MISSEGLFQTQWQKLSWHMSHCPIGLLGAPPPTNCSPAQALLNLSSPRLSPTLGDEKKERQLCMFLPGTNGTKTPRGCDWKGCLGRFHSNSVIPALAATCCMACALSQVLGGPCCSHWLRVQEWVVNPGT